MSMKLVARRSALIWTIALLFAALMAVGANQAKAANPYERGPAPTLASVEAVTGPFATAKVSAPKTSGFNGGTIYYPTSTTDGTFAAFVICPGFTRDQTSISWYGPRIASQGFVVMTINTKSTLDFPDSRATQMLAALDWLTTSSTVKTRIDSTRLGVMGQSMGGGATLKASKTRPSLQAAFGTAPYNGDKNWSTNTVPTFLFGMQNDSTAPPSSHAIPFYNSLPASIHKIYAELRGAAHSDPTSPNTTIARYAISFMKRELDDDTRYSQFLCPAPPVGSPYPLSKFFSTCNF